MEWRIRFVFSVAHSRRGAYRMDVSTMGGKSFESGYCNLLDKTGLAPNVKGDHREIYSRGIYPRRGVTLNLGFWFALFVGLAVVTQGQAEEYYIYHDTDGKLVISNKEPPPGSKIIKRLPGVTDREAPQAQEPGNTQPTSRQKAHR